LAARSPENAAYARNVFVSLNKLGDLYRTEGSLVQALEYYSRALRICEQLADRSPENANWQRDLWAAHWRIALMHEERADEPAAQEAWRRAYGVLTGMQERGLFLSEKDQRYLTLLRQRIAGG
jgi:tetratricopeptide (TPR) repeat protein